MIRDGISPSPPRVRADWTRLPDGERRGDQRRVDLARVAVQVDLGARRAGDEGGGAAGGGAPHQPVDQPVLERLQRRLAEPRGLQAGAAHSRVPACGTERMTGETGRAGPMRMKGGCSGSVMPRP